MRSVSKDDFYKEIYSRNLNVHPSIQPGPWPYTSIWKYLSSGAVFGKCIDQRDGNDLYFLSDN